MKLTSIFAINWHLIPKTDIRISGDTAFLGENTAGKSTILDLMQIVMSGANSKYYDLNASAGDGQKSSNAPKRTLEGYCLGQLGVDIFERDANLTYIGLVFEDPDQERQPVSIGIAMEARRGEKALIYSRFIVNGLKLTSDDFVEKGERGVLPKACREALDDIRDTVEKKSGDYLEYDKVAIDYVREYMRLLSTGGSFNDPTRILKALKNGLAFKHMKTATDFVRQYILVENNIDLKALRDSVYKWQEINRIIRTVARKVEKLDQITVGGDDFNKQLERRELFKALKVVNRFEQAKREREIVRSKWWKARKEFLHCNDQLQNIKKEISDFDKELDSLREIQAQSSVAGEIASVRSQIKAMCRELDREKSELNKRRNQLMASLNFGTGNQYLNAFPALGDIVTALTNDMKSDDLDWPKQPDRVDRMLKDFKQRAEPFTTFLEGEEIRLSGSINQHSLEIKRLKTTLKDADHGIVRNDPQVDKYLKLLSEEDISARVLCEQIEVMDDKWRDAVEGLLGWDREAIFVSKEDHRRAIEILRNNRRELRHCRVANVSKLDINKCSTHSGTLASVLASEDKEVMAFVIYRIGNVYLANRQDDLKRKGRVIMPDGTYDDGISTRTISVPDRKLGASAKKFMEQQWSHELDRRTREHEELRLDLKFIKNTGTRVVTIGDLASEEKSLTAVCCELARIEEEISKAKDRLTCFEERVDPQIEKQIASASEQIEHLRDNQSEYFKQAGAHKKEIENQRAISRDANDQRLGSKANLHAALKEMRTISNYAITEELQQNLTGTLEAERKQVAESLHHKSGGKKITPQLVDNRLAAHINHVIAKADDKYKQLEREIRDLYHQYLSIAQEASKFGAQDDLNRGIVPWARTTLSRLRNIELERHEQTAKETAAKMNRLFQTDFVENLRERLEMAEEALKDLNNSLKNHPFHNERYRFERHYEADFSPIIELVNASAQDDTILLPLFAESIEDDHPHKQALKVVDEILSDKEFQIEKFADYRNYLRFSLKMKDIHTNVETDYQTRKGTGSGAEKQVPFYVAMGAALSSVYHGRKGLGGHKQGIGLAVFDEAFSKMDGPNQQQMLNFYRMIGLQTIIAAPTDRKHTLMEGMECIVNVRRIDNITDTRTLAIKPRLRQAIKNANPRNNIDALRKEYDSTR